MTTLLLVITLIVAAAIVLVLVFYLIAIILALKKAANDLEKLAGSLVAIRDDTAPLGGHVQAVNGGLSQLLAGLLGVNTDLEAIINVARRG